MKERFAALWRSLAALGRAEGGGYVRYSWTQADLDCREWFVEEALDRELTVETDRNGNLWAWWGDPAAGDAVVTGSHLDSVPHGGGYDGPLGIVSALLAVDVLREKGCTPRRPLGIAVFTEEEGARFGLACLGSRLLTGAIPAERALALSDRDGVSLAEALVANGIGLEIGPDPERLRRIGCFVELHIEQGRGLRDHPVGVASAIWPHGRWRLEITGEANHAGTTLMDDRRDPMLTFAYAVLAANKEARLSGGHATIGRVDVDPNATNAVPARVRAWLDARAPAQSELDDLVAAIATRVRERAERDGTTLTISPESLTPVVPFDTGLRDRIQAAIGEVPVLPTAAGHDAGVLATAGIPAAMLFVRNPTGVSHAPQEHASDADCAAGVVALAAVLEDLTCR